LLETDLLGWFSNSERALRYYKRTQSFSVYKL